jgi:hypothetical protein
VQWLFKLSWNQNIFSLFQLALHFCTGTGKFQALKGTVA